MANSSGEDFECNIGESSQVFTWPTQVVEIFGTILVNLFRYLSDPLKW